MSEGTRSEAMPAGDEPESRRTTTTTNSSAADSGDDDDPQGEVEDFFDIDPRSLSYSSSTDLNSSRSSSCDASTGASGTCAVSVLSTPGHSKPHKANDAGWEAIRGISLGSAPRPLGISQFRILHRLGRGDIGSVYLAELRGTACHFALKVMDKKGLSSRNKLLRAETERAILQMLDHPFLPTLYAHLDNAHFSCLVMEFCPGGDLHVLRQRQPAKRFGDHAARFYAAEVLLALEYLHMMGIVYRDLKPENVLVRDDGHIMLTDFDLSLQSSVRPSLLRTPEVPRRPVPSTTSSSSSSSCILPACVMPCTGAPQGQHPAVVVSCLPMFTRRKKSKAKAKAKAKVKQWHRGHDATETLGVTLPELLAEPTEARSMSFVGTHEYLSPEIIAGDGHGNAVDWWTFGIFLFELLYGRTPFRGSDNEKTLANVVSQPLRFPDEGAEVGGMLSPPPSTAAKDLVRSLLVKDPFKRLGSTRGATEIKQHAFFHGVNWALIRCSIPPHIPSPFHPPTRCSPPPEKNASSDFEYF